MIQAIFGGSVFRTTRISQSWVSDLNQVWGGNGAIITAS